MPISIAAPDFLARYNLPKEALDRTGLSWDSLTAIYDDHQAATARLDPTVRYIVDSLRSLPEVHSLRYRVKNPEHLIAKIIRKKSDRIEFEVTPQNYREVITDLIGIRALHLFKDEWLQIHNYIVATWELHESPTANIRKGDSEELRAAFETHGCTVKEHSAGYRSIHYLIKSHPGKELFIAELQVRTLFEEGWSEIDHRIRYPHALENAVLAEYLVMFNRLAGSADEMGTYVRRLETHLAENDSRFREAEAKQCERLKELEDAISKLDIAKKEKEALEKKVRELTAAGIAVGAQANIARMPPPKGGVFDNRIFGNQVVFAGTPPLFANPKVTGLPTSGQANPFGKSVKCVVCGKEFVQIIGMTMPGQEKCSEHQNWFSIKSEYST